MEADASSEAVRAPCSLSNTPYQLYSTVLLAQQGRSCRNDWPGNIAFSLRLGPPAAMATPSLVNLANQYINVDNIVALHQQYAPFYAALASSSSSSPPPSQGLPTHLSFESSIFPAPAASFTTLQSFLTLLSPTLLSLNCSRSNLTGRLFFQGRTLSLTPAEAAEARIFIEGRERAGGKIIVRDDDPPITLRDPSASSSPHPPTFRYVSTAYHEPSSTFTRTYAQMGWLSLREVNLSSTDLSSHGLQSLLCCTAHSLTVLRLNDCPHVDNSGLFTLTALCRHLHTLELNHCHALTEHALMALADMPPASIAALSFLSVQHPTIPSAFFTALLTALQDRGFHGLYTYDPVQARQVRGTPTSLSSQLRPRCVQDLTLRDVTGSTLKLISPDALQRFHETKAALVQRWSGEQQRQYGRLVAAVGGTQPPGPVYSLDLSPHPYVNDTLLRHILGQFGPSLYVLKLSHTYVTAQGLAALTLCPNLRVLSLSSCHSLHDKQAANGVMMDTVRGMPDLMELNISDSRLSGRMLTKHPMLSLFTFYAHACPISTRAVRLLSETCARSLSVLSLSRCPFINVQSMYYVMKMTQLVMLDVSFCPALTGSEVAVLEEFEGQEMRRINVSGVHGLTVEICRRIGTGIGRRRRERGGEYVEVEVIGDDEGSFTPTGASSLSSPAHLQAAHFNYHVMEPSHAGTPQFNAATQQRIRQEVDRALHQQAVEEKEREAQQAVSPPPTEEGLYSVLPSVLVDEADDFPAISSTPTRPHHQHSHSYSGAARPPNPTPSSSVQQGGWPGLHHPGLQHARTLPRHLPSQSVASSAVSSYGGSPVVTASTPSGAVGGRGRGGGGGRPGLHPHVSLPVSPVAGGLEGEPPPMVNGVGEGGMLGAPAAGPYSPLTSTE